MMDFLSSVKGLAFPKQVDVELITRVTFDPLCQKLYGEITDYTCHPLNRGCGDHSYNSSDQSGELPVSGSDDIESPAHEDLNIAVSHVVHDRGDDRDQRKEGITHQVG